MADERKPLDDVLGSLKQAAEALEAFRKTARVCERRSLRKSAKAPKKLLAGTNAEADLLLPTWIAVAEDGSAKKSKN